MIQKKLPLLLQLPHPLPFNNTWRHVLQSYAAADSIVYIKDFFFFNQPGIFGLDVIAES